MYLWKKTCEWINVFDGNKLHHQFELLLQLSICIINLIVNLLFRTIINQAESGRIFCYPNTWSQYPTRFPTRSSKNIISLWSNLHFPYKICSNCIIANKIFWNIKLSNRTKSLKKLIFEVYQDRNMSISFKRYNLMVKSSIYFS